MASEAARAAEAILMVADEPVEPQLLAQLLEISPARVDELCEELAAAYQAEDRGFVLARVAGGWRFRSHPDLAPYVERFVLDGQPSRLSPAALETLAIVAYLGPCSRPEIARIRGVAADSAVAGLVERGLIAEAGRDDEAGAVRYRTTPLFERVFGLDGLSQLPRLDDVGVGAEQIRERLESVADRRTA